MVDEGIGGAKISVTACYENKRRILSQWQTTRGYAPPKWRGNGVEVGTT